MRPCVGTPGTSGTSGTLRYRLHSLACSVTAAMPTDEPMHADSHLSIAAPTLTPAIQRSERPTPDAPAIATRESAQENQACTGPTPPTPGASQEPACQRRVSQDPGACQEPASRSSPPGPQRPSAPAPAVIEPRAGPRLRPRLQSLSCFPLLPDSSALLAPPPTPGLDDDDGTDASKDGARDATSAERSSEARCVFSRWVWVCLSGLWGQ